MLAYHQLSEKRGYASPLDKSTLLTQVGRIASTAYEQGASLEEVRAICGAAFGDWSEAQHLKASQEAPQTNESARDYQG